MVLANDVSCCCCRYTYVGAITDYPELYWAWTASTVGPVVYVLALVHAFMSKRTSAALGSVVSSNHKFSFPPSLRN